MTEDTAACSARTPGHRVTFGELIRDGGAKESSSGRSMTSTSWFRAPDHQGLSLSGTKEVYQLRLASGREVKASANHPFLTFSGWTPLGELHTGDRVAIPRHIPVPVGAGLGLVRPSDRPVSPT